ncbi:MAG: CdaR family protein [Treponema sp.]|nr:CdaR family protein [Treponema sp.]MCL2250701.1 CdaR family protein [Treponema sp.]
MINIKFISKIIEKWPVKVLSLAAALIISVFYRMNTLETRFFSAPLQIEESETLIPVNSIATAVRISLRGESDEIQPILEEDIETFIDLEKFTNEGTYRVPVQIRKKGSALGIEPLEVSVQPLEITVELEQKITRSIPIFPVFSGTVASGYELTNQHIIPDRVTAEGPRRELESKIEFNTEIIDLERRYEDFTSRVSIIIDNPLINIHGDKMIEYRATIRRIVREEQDTRTRLPVIYNTQPLDMDFDDNLHANIIDTDNMNNNQEDLD